MKIKRFYCSTDGCNKSFRSEEQLDSHISSHSIEKVTQADRLSFECDICNGKFPTKRSVSAHKRIHLLCRRGFCAKKILNLLACRLSGPEYFEYQIPIGPFTIENSELPPITGQQVGDLPQFIARFNQ